MHLFGRTQNWNQKFIFFSKNLVQQQSPCMETGLLINGTQSENVTYTTATSTPIPALKKAGRPLQAMVMANGHFSKPHFSSGQNSRSKSLQNMSTKIKFIENNGNCNDNGKHEKQDWGRKPFRLWFFRGLKQVRNLIMNQNPM